MIIGGIGILIIFFIFVNIMALFGNEDAQDWVKQDQEKADGCLAPVLLLVFCIGFVFWWFTHH